MVDIVEFFKGLFETDLWPARWHCGYWSSFHGWLYIGSDLMIWLAYSAIPLIILNFISRKRIGLKFPAVYYLFAAFILLCGTTHFLDATMFYVPMYRFNAVVRFITGVVSLLTVYHMIKILPEAFRLKTTGELELEIVKRQEAERRLAEANRGLETFAYMASHDLQEPLRKIAAFSTILLQESKQENPPSSEETIGKIASSASRMQRLIKDVLALSSIPESTIFTVVDMNAVVEKAKQDLEIRIKEKMAIIEVGTLPAVKGNEAYLTQLFVNLISNAIKFSSEHPFVEIKGFSTGDTVTIVVQDNGIGMRHEETDKIFQAFTRLNSKSKYDGSGIGLAICKKIIDLHGGSIAVESELGRGTTFTLTFPSTA